MRIYSAADEEALRARELVKEWSTDEGVLSKAQCKHLQEETVVDLRTTNVFLRVVLFVFTLIALGAVVGLFLEVFLSHPSQETSGVVLLFFAVTCYIAAELAVSQALLYHHGIEEALAVCAIGFLCAGLGTVLTGDRSYAAAEREVLSLILLVGALSSLWIWYRFNLWYAFVAAMVFVYMLPVYWTTSHAAQLLIVVAFYAAGLGSVIATVSHHRDDYLESAYSLAEAFLWMGMYLTLNLKLSATDFIGHFGSLGIRSNAEFARSFYWTTWVLIWCLPPVVLLRGIRQKNRLVLAVGGITALLTLVTNKPYLGWQRHSWDPMLLGVALCGVVWFLRRWLAAGANGVRGGFTAARLSGKDERWLQVGSSVVGLRAPSFDMPGAQTNASDFEFGGGTSDGGGASGNF
jgi:hypothetical protein